MAKFIVIEGVDGAGKSTLVSGLVESLEKDGKLVVSTREPGGTPLAEEIRTKMLSEEGAKLTPAEQLELVHKGRVDHVKNKIVPSLQSGYIVISDRYELSSWVYQGVFLYKELEPRFYEMQAELNDLLGEYRPVYIVLDLPEIEVKERLQTSKKLNHFDATTLESIAARRKAYLEGVVSIGSQHHIVNASTTPTQLILKTRQLLGL